MPLQEGAVRRERHFAERVDRRDYHHIGCIAAGDGRIIEFGGVGVGVEAGHAQQGGGVPAALGEVCAGEVGLDEAGAAQVSAAEAGVAEVGPASRMPRRSAPRRSAPRRLRPVRSRSRRSAPRRSARPAPLRPRRAVTSSAFCLAVWVTSAGRELAFRPLAGQVMPGQVAQEVGHQPRHAPGGQDRPPGGRAVRRPQRWPPATPSPTGGRS